MPKWLTNLLVKGWVKATEFVTPSGSSYGTDATVQEDLEVKGLSNQAGIYSIENGALSVLNPKGSTYYRGSSTAEGAIKIKLPLLNSNTIFRFTVYIRRNQADDDTVLHIGGWDANNGEFYHTNVANISSKESNDYTVRFGYDNSTRCIWIGETDTSWGHLNFSIKNFQVSNGSLSEKLQWAKDWNISLVTEFDTVQVTKTNNFIWGDWDKLKGKPSNLLYDESSNIEFTFGDGINGGGGNGLLIEGTNAALELKGGTGTGYRFYSLNDDSFRIYSTPGGYRFTLDKLGRVGIGTVSPSEKLEVNGNILAASFIKSGGINDNILLDGGGTEPLTNFAKSSDIPTDYVDLSTGQDIDGIKRFSQTIRGESISDLNITPPARYGVKILSPTFNHLNGPGGNYFTGLHFNPYDGGGGYQGQLGVASTNDETTAFSLRVNEGGTWKPWRKLWHEGNLTPDDYIKRVADSTDIREPNSTGTGYTTGDGGYTYLRGHDSNENFSWIIRNYTSAQGDGKIQLDLYNGGIQSRFFKRVDGTNENILLDGGGTKAVDWFMPIYNGSTGDSADTANRSGITRYKGEGLPTSTHYTTFTAVQGDNGGYGWQLAGTADKFYLRYKNSTSDTSWTNWREIWHSGNLKFGTGNTDMARGNHGHTLQEVTDEGNTTTNAIEASQFKATSGIIDIYGDNAHRLRAGAYTDNLGTEVSIYEIALETRHIGTTGLTNISQKWHHDGGSTFYYQGNETLNIHRLDTFTYKGNDIFHEGNLTQLSQLSNDETDFATVTYVGEEIAKIVDSSPDTLNTLNELAAALGNDDNFAATVSTQIGERALKTTKIEAGTGLDGGGDLSADRTIYLSETTQSNLTTAYNHSQSAHAPSDAEKNVQSDWNEEDTTSDAFIKNRPSIPSLTGYATEQWVKDKGYFNDVGVNDTTGDIVFTRPDSTPETINLDDRYSITSHNHDSRYVKYNGLWEDRDLNTFTDPGMYRLHTPEMNHNEFPNATYGNLLTVSGGADTLAQMGFPYLNDEIYFRRGTNSNIGGNSWKRLWHEGNLPDYKQFGLGHGPVTTDYNALGNQSHSFARNNGLNAANAPTPGVHSVWTVGNNDRISSLGAQLALGYSSAYGAYTDPDIYIRSKSTSSSWGGWKKVWHSGNFNPSGDIAGKVDKAGDTMSGNLEMKKNAPKIRLINNIVANGGESGELFLGENETMGGYLRYDGSTNKFYIGSYDGGRYGAITINRGEQDITVSRYAYADDFKGPSDIRLKKDIKSFEPEKIDSTYKKYVYKRDEESKVRTGLIAQELEEKHPEFVYTDKDGFKSISYIDLHSAEIAYLKKENDEIRQELDELKEMITKLIK